MNSITETKGIVYLIQPATYINTNCYKIGMSNKETIDRIKNYKLHTRVLCVYNCDNPSEVEKNLIEAFTEQFEVIQGKEYFKVECKEQDIQNLFMSIINSQIVNSKTFFKKIKEEINPIYELLLEMVLDLKKYNMIWNDTCNKFCAIKENDLEDFYLKFLRKKYPKCNPLSKKKVKEIMEELGFIYEKTMFPRDKKEKYSDSEQRYAFSVKKLKDVKKNIRLKVYPKEEETKIVETQVIVESQEIVEPQVININDKILQSGKHEGEKYMKIRKENPEYFLYLISQPASSVYHFFDYIQYCMGYITN